MLYTFFEKQMKISVQNQKKVEVWNPGKKTKYGR